MLLQDFASLRETDHGGQAALSRKDAKLRKDAKSVPLLLHSERFSGNDQLCGGQYRYRHVGSQRLSEDTVPLPTPTFCDVIVIQPAVEAACQAQRSSATTLIVPEPPLAAND